MEGKLEKLKILAYEDSEFKSKVGEYEVSFNPEEFTEKFEIKFEDTQPGGSIGAELKFIKKVPETFELNMVFDGTGVASNSQSTEIKTVPDQLTEFRELVVDYSGSKHEPRYLTLIWGTYFFAGRLTNLDVTYTLFKPDGTPLRAKAIAKFAASIEKKAEVATKDANSPDLTHIRVVKEGDTLPLMTYRIYGDSSYYVEVARVNNLTNFRKLATGQRMIFPPIEKTV